MEGDKSNYSNNQNEALESRKAHLVDILLERRLRFDPLKILTEELWRMIVLESTSEKTALKRWSGEIRKAISLDLVLSLTLVSKAWSEALLSSPVFWTEASFLEYYYAENGPVRTQLCIHLSWDAAISIHLDGLSTLADTLSLILSIKHRVKEIRIHGSTSDVWMLIANLSPFPLLTRIEYNYPKKEYSIASSIHAILQRNPILESVTGLNLPPNLRQFETYEPFEAVANSDRDWTLPIDIRFDHQDSTESPLRTNTSPSASSQESKFLPWKHVTHTSSDFNTKWLLRLPSLVTLQVRISFVWLGDLAMLLPDLPRLDHLSVLIPECDINAPLVMQSLGYGTIGKASSIRTFHLRQEGLRVEVGTAYGQALCSLFAQVMPSVTLMNIDLASPMDTIHWINGSQFLSTRDLTFIWDSHIPMFRTAITNLSPSIETVKCIIRSVIPQITGSAVKNLKIVHSSDYHGLRGRTCNMENWSSLTKLSTDDHQFISWNTVHPPHSQVLKLKVSFSRLDDSVTRFSCELALSPSNLPSLRELSFGAFPRD